MYYISKLSVQSMDFVKRISSAANNRTTTFPIAVGYAVAHALALPNQEVDDIDGYFRMQCKMNAERYVNVINEMLPFDYKEGLALTLAFYKYRYRAMAPKSIPLAFNPETAIEDFFSLSTFFSKGVLEAIKKKPEDMTNFVNGLTTFFAEVQKKELDDAEAQAKAQAGKDVNYVAP